MGIHKHENPRSGDKPGSLGETDTLCLKCNHFIWNMTAESQLIHDDMTTYSVGHYTQLDQAMFRFLLFPLFETPIFKNIYNQTKVYPVTTPPHHPPATLTVISQNH